MKFSKSLTTKAAMIALFSAATSLQAQTTRYVDIVNCRTDNQLGTSERPYCAIQTGIDRAYDGDTVIVRDGTYDEKDDLNDTQLVFIDRPLEVRSENGPATTIIDGKGGVPFGIEFRTGESADGDQTGERSIFDGFTITGAESTGIRCIEAHPTIRNCVMTGNGEATLGGGVMLQDSNARFENCVIHENKATDNGGGVYITGGNPTLIGCRLSDNEVNYEELREANEKLTFAVKPGGPPAGFAYHPTYGLYYGSVMDDSGQEGVVAYIFRERQNTYLDKRTYFSQNPRAWFYNPNPTPKTLEIVTQSAVYGEQNGGLYEVGLDADGHFPLSDRVIPQLSPLPGLPSTESAPAYDPLDNVLYARV